MNPFSNKTEIFNILLQNLRENDIERLELNMEKHKEQIQENSISQLLFLTALHCENNEQSQTFINFLINM